MHTRSRKYQYPGIRRYSDISPIAYLLPLLPVSPLPQVMTPPRMRKIRCMPSKLPSARSGHATNPRDRWRNASSDCSVRFFDENRAKSHRILKTKRRYSCTASENRPCPQPLKISYLLSSPISYQQPLLPSLVPVAQ